MTILRTEFSALKGRYLHPEYQRPITHREAARLMGFPDDFIFKGGKNRHCTADWKCSASSARWIARPNRKISARKQGGSPINRGKAPLGGGNCRDGLSLANCRESLRAELVQLLTNFADELRHPDLRVKVIALVPAFHRLRDLGSSLMPMEDGASGRDRILAYLRKYPFQVIDGDELMVVSGIGEWGRRVRELRVQFGWWIYSGVTFAHIEDAATEAGDTAELLNVRDLQIRPNQYILMRNEEDREVSPIAGTF